MALLAFPPRGGSGRVAASLARALADEGIEVHLCLRGEEGPEIPGVEVHSIRPPSYAPFEEPLYWTALASELAGLAERRGIDLVHAHYALPHAPAALLADRMLGTGRLRLVTTLHGTDASLVGGQPPLRRVVRHSLEESDLVTAVSPYLADLTRTSLGFRGEVRVLPDFLGDEAFLPRTEPPWWERGERSPRRILHLGSFRGVKRADDLCLALGAIARRVPIEADLCGAGPEREAAENRIRDLGLESRVRFRGRVEDPGPLLRRADLYLFSSRSESFGMGMLEAMAAGVPVAGPAVGGVPWVLGDPPGGILVPPSAPHALAEAACLLLTRPDLHREASARALARAGDFSRSAVVPRWIELYAETRMRPSRRGP